MWPPPHCSGMWGPVPGDGDGWSPSKCQLWTIPPGCTNTSSPSVLPKCKRQRPSLAGVQLLLRQGRGLGGPLQPGIGPAPGVTHREEGEQAMGGVRPQGPEEVVWVCRSG